MQCWTKPKIPTTHETTNYILESERDVLERKDGEICVGEERKINYWGGKRGGGD